MTSKPASDPWLVRPRPNPAARLRLFCFPYAGGGAGIFRSWPAGLPASIEVCSVQLPGRERRLLEPPLTTFPALLQALGPALIPYLDLPCAVFGHSMGALVAFEWTRQMRRISDLLPLHLFASGYQAPQLPSTNAPIHALPEPAFIAALRRLNGTPEAVLQSAELLQLTLPGLRADFALAETYTYTPEAPLACPITACGGEQDAEALPEQLSAWREQTSRVFALRLFPGDHFFLHSAQAALLQAIEEDLEPYLQAL